MEVRVTVPTKQLVKLAAVTNNFKKGEWLYRPIRISAHYMISEISTTFMREGRPIKWPKWKPKYKKFREKVGETGGKILFLTGKEKAKGTRKKKLPAKGSASAKNKDETTSKTGEGASAGDKAEGGGGKKKKRRLVYAGALKRSITAIDKVRFKKKGFLFGTRVKYAAAHQMGFSKKGVPKRAYVKYMPHNIIAIQKIFVKEIEILASKAGGMASGSGPISKGLK